MTGHDRDYIGLLAWPNVSACEGLVDDPDTAGDATRLIRSIQVVECIRSGLERYNAEHPGSSTRIRRVILLAEPPDIDANEITDKGYVNQQAALERRKAAVVRLYAEPPEADVIMIDS